jgi:hypothetical protein
MQLLLKEKTRKKRRKIIRLKIRNFTTKGNYIKTHVIIPLLVESMEVWPCQIDLTSGTFDNMLVGELYTQYDHLIS